ncbi:hypothetical protein [Pseudomonas phoenicis]|uniref:hypothetical protein n=1 Tax=unclassified Pseudomonas TaxID=196821 RepID=UPI00399FAAF5
MKHLGSMPEAGKPLEVKAAKRCRLGGKQRQIGEDRSGKINFLTGADAPAC